MTRSDTLRTEISRLIAKGSSLTSELAKHREAASKARSAASKKRDEAARARSDISRRSATSAAEREDKKEVAATKKAGDTEKKIADNDKAIAAKRTSLTSAERSEQNTKDREQASRDRKDTQRRASEKAHARDLARLAKTTHEVRYIEIKEPQPEVLRVLYLTANPEAVETTSIRPDGTIDTIGTWLRVDQEVRQVKALLKASKYRDLVDLQHLPAATSTDLMDGLNEHRPHVVHFSGHASSLGLVMEDDMGSEDGRDLEFDLLARLLGATDTPPTLLVLNACDSLSGADDLLQTVPIVVAMADSVVDSSAVVFASRFYSAIASAQSVGSALEQGRVAMDLASLEGSDLPEARSRDDVDLSSIILVRP
ncbi:CHAT domain-containing protein [Kribbella sp. NPDC051587]|uniref:CHAT domain-containing protein n=1 Tax=Kribbella sp. NPDC051587 TaxID=3364119 RepID=UPI0037B90FE8